MTDAPVTIGMRPPHPGAFIREEVLEPLHLSVAQAADVLGVRRATLSDLLKTARRPCRRNGLRIEEPFRLSLEMLLRMQAWFERLRHSRPFRSDRCGAVCPPAAPRARLKDGDDLVWPISTGA